MILTKILKVKNVGRLTALSPTGDVQFRRLNLIYGDNGSGKTTITAILRSAHSGDSAPITERATLGVAEPAEVHLLVNDNDTLRFDGRGWSTTFNNIEIFDDTFVRDNVYAGDVVDKEQRRNLYQVVVGPVAVRLARRVDELDSENRAAAKRIRDLEGALQTQIQAPFSIDAFLALTPVADVDDRIAAVTRELSAARNAAALVSRPHLSNVRLPQSPRRLLDVLGRAQSEVSHSAVRRVREHIAQQLGPEGEAWLRQGLHYTEDGGPCPFCTQSTSGIEIVEIYHTFFSKSYEEHVVQIQRAINEVDNSFNSTVFSEVERTASENAERIRGWRDLVELDYADLSVDRPRAVWANLRNTLTDALRRKLANPGATLSSMDAVEAAVLDYEAVLEELIASNGEIDRANESIANVKQQAARGDQRSLEQELRRLRNSQIRQEPQCKELCERLIEARRRKTELEREKGQTREELVSQAESLLRSYEDEINSLLRRLGATFSLKGTTPSFVGGKASSTYKISINNVSVDVGDSSTPPGTPCFRTVLSAGDKSALALAFFLVRLKRDSTLANKVIVFDDPLTSLDAFRTTFTQQYIARLSENVKQVIVLSHDPFFLKGVLDLDSGPTKAMKLARAGSTIQLKEWDIRQHCLSEAQKDYFVLRRFLEDGLPDGGDLMTIARAIRPYLEGYLRNRYPEEFGPGLGLGDFVGRVRTSVSGEDLHSLLASVDDLDDLNTFSRRAHHGSAGGPPVAFSEEEVRASVQQALDFVRRPVGT